MTISERIFKKMDELGLSQMEFSKRTGITQSTISDWKRKKTNPSADKILVICEVLSISPYELLQDTYNISQNSVREYKIITQGTACYDLVLEFEDLTPDKKERLFGYLQALKD